MIADLKRNGFVMHTGKGSHRNFTHPRCALVLTISGADGDDAKPYQEKAVQSAYQMVVNS